jgi:demethylmenaquinone methyltransferase/2-methoxy-6-polyprenyl-1,4-benzoquinol methylase
MPTTKEEIRDVYRKRAGNYDFTVQIYHLLGFRMGFYREQAVEALHLKAGDTVVDIACGTGANFSLLQEKIGPNGRIVGVDFTDAMLTKAQERITENQWRNVELVRSDVAAYQFPVDGVISTFAIIYVPEFDEVIRNGSNSLSAQGRFVVLDFKVPSGWISRLTRFLLFVTRPWGLSMELASRHPWESIGKHLKHMRLTELYGGFVFLAVGEREENFFGVS